MISLIMNTSHEFIRVGDTSRLARVRDPSILSPIIMTLPPFHCHTSEVTADDVPGLCPRHKSASAVCSLYTVCSLVSGPLGARSARSVGRCPVCTQSAVCVSSLQSGLRSARCAVCAVGRLVSVPCSLYPVCSLHAVCSLVSGPLDARSVGRCPVQSDLSAGGGGAVKSRPSLIGGQTFD